MKLTYFACMFCSARFGMANSWVRHIITNLTYLPTRFISSIVAFAGCTHYSASNIVATPLIVSCRCFKSITKQVYFTVHHLPLCAYVLIYYSFMILTMAASTWTGSIQVGVPSFRKAITLPYGASSIVLSDFHAGTTSRSLFMQSMQSFDFPPLERLLRAPVGSRPV